MCDSLSCGCYTARKNEMGTELATVWWIDRGVTLASAGPSGEAVIVRNAEYTCVPCEVSLN